MRSQTLRGTVYRLPKADAMQSLKNGIMVILFGIMICLFMFTWIAVSTLESAGIRRIQVDRHRVRVPGLKT